MGIFDKASNVFEQGRSTVQVNLRLTPEVRAKLEARAERGGYVAKGTGLSGLVTDLILGKAPGQRDEPNAAQPPEAVFADDARTAHYMRQTIRVLCDRVKAQQHCGDCAEIGITLQEMERAYYNALKATQALYENRVLATKGDRWTG